MNDLPLGDLDAFTAVARERSFRAAARRRGVSPSALSAALRRLEERLGVRLLNRTTRSVTPTEAGLRLMERLAPALGEISSALDQLESSRDSPAGTLRLNVPTIIARTVLPDIAARFLAAHPKITLEVVAEDSFIDVLAAGYDAGVRYDERLERDMIAIPIGPRRQRYVTAAAPAYIERHGVPARPEELLEHSCIRHRFVSGHAHGWEFEGEGREVTISPSGPIVANSLDLELAAAVAGLGIIHTFEEPLLAALETGALVRILADWSPAFSGPFLYYAGRRHMPAPLRAFVDFVKRDRRGAG